VQLAGAVSAPFRALQAMSTHVWGCQAKQTFDTSWMCRKCYTAQNTALAYLLLAT
jgi:hypothetical protein